MATLHHKERTVTAGPHGWQPFSAVCLEQLTLEMLTCGRQKPACPLLVAGVFLKTP